MLRRKIVRSFVNWTDPWNAEIHEAIQSNVMAEYQRLFPHPHDDFEEMDKRIQGMREFYYMRMSATANILIACCSVVVSIVALVVAIIALFHT